MSVHTDRAKGCKTTKLVLIDAGHSSLFFGGREATTGNASAVRRLDIHWYQFFGDFKEEFFCSIEV